LAIITFSFPGIVGFGCRHCGIGSSALARTDGDGALGSREMWWSLALIAGAFSWALGSVPLETLAIGRVF